jgi:hypothetical protein
LVKDKEIMNNDIENIKQNLSEYVNSNKNFFNLYKHRKINDDVNNNINNTHFLLGSQLINCNERRLTHRK